MSNPEETNIAKATLHPSGKQFEVYPGLSLLESGLSTGIALPFGCANGSCGDCRARIINGSVNRIKPHDYTLTAAQKLEGQCLLCSYTAESDVDIEVLEAQSVNDIPQQDLKAKPCELESYNEVDIVTFKFVRGKALRFLPGQSITLTLDDGFSPTLPIASCPCNAQLVELHIRKPTVSETTENGLRKQILQTFTERKTISLKGPSGGFTLTSDTNKPKFFYASGIDFAQVQGMVEQILNSELNVPCCLLWQATKETSHYRENLCRSWHDAFDEFTFVPVHRKSTLLASLPKVWESLLLESEVYLGGDYQELIAELLSRGLSLSAIKFPTSTSLSF